MAVFTRYTDCDHCRAVKSRSSLREWTDKDGVEHTVCPDEVDDYLAVLRDKSHADKIDSED